MLRLNNFKVIPETMRRGTVGFAAAYIRGDIEVDDLTALFRYFLQNRDDLRPRKEPGLFRRAAQDIAYHMSRANTNEGTKENISEHYDLGNDFYGEWLDPSMTYSSAIFTSGDQSLEEAQRAKYHRVADMAGVKPGETVLEIGCGWGGFAETVARDYGAERLRHHAVARAARRSPRSACARQGLDDLRDLRVRGLSRHRGPVRPRRLDRDDRGGRRGALAELLPDRARPAEARRHRRDPGHHHRREGFRGLPRRPRLHPALHLPRRHAADQDGDAASRASASASCSRTSENFRQSYAKTLRLWRERFLERWPMIAPLGYDEEFRRKWVYYLSYCEAGFEEGSIDVGIYQYRRPA